MADLGSDIEKYRRGELTSAEMHALEKKALHDPFLAEALEGLESIPPDDISMDVKEINQRLLSEKKIATWFTPLRIAAGMTLLIGSIFLIYNFNGDDKQLALQKEAAPSQTSPVVEDSSAKKNQPELLSLNQEKEVQKIHSPKQKTEGPSAKSAEGGGELKPTDNASITSEAEPTVKSEDAKADQPVIAELSEITAEEKAPEREKVAAAPTQQGFKKEALDKDVVSGARARKSAIADDVTPQKIVTGHVTSSEDGLPLPGVNVMIKGTTHAAVTDMQGGYSIPVENENQKLVFSFVGLQSSEVPVENKSIINVNLLEDNTQLSEVVVTGAGVKTDRDQNDSPVITLATPVSGKKAYNTYLETNLRYPQTALNNNVKGKAVIEFTVGSDGVLTDFTIIKSLTHECNDEVIRLIKEGPRWLPTMEDDVPVASKARVKVRFDPSKQK